MPVLTPADFEGGGCDCPDYTSILNAIYQKLRSIESFLTEFYDYISAFYDFYTAFAEGYLISFTGDLNWNDEYNLGYQLGDGIGLIASNIWDVLYYPNLYAGIGNGVFDVNGVRTGPKFLQEMWNYILRPFAQTWADYEWDPDNRMIHGFRDFYIGDHVVAVTNEPENPIWVEFTNSVSLSDETLSALTNTFSRLTN